MKRSGLADLLPSLHETVYVGVSAGSTVMAPTLGEGFVRSNLPGGDTALGLVDFAMFPHLDDEELPGKSMNHAEKWAASVPIPAFAIDDQTAIKVTDGVVEVVSEGRWKLFEPTPETS
jgi:dipeptidase E